LTGIWLIKIARQLCIEYSGAFYHITSRSNEPKPVFKSKRDREANKGSHISQIIIVSNV